ncbi:MAG: glycosyltransferase family 4 protein [Desulfobacterota bacterium]|nr:glycosyltransferase family 4 protein [Thermodesulfobacteriota bacterium]MDW8002201.1 glycosyltransferase family 4 protein [Deltaproteobacteria bacterium]
MRRLKIAIVLNRFFPSSGGQSYFSFLASELSKKGHEVYVFAIDAEDKNPKDYKLVLVPVIKRPKFLRIISFILATRRILSKHEFDIIHMVDEGLTMNVFNPHGGVEKAYLKQEFASIDNRLYYLLRWLRRYLSPSHYLILWLQKRQFKGEKVKKIIAISQMVKENIQRYYGIDESKIAYVFNTCDLNRFRPENRERFLVPVREKLGIPLHSCVLMFAGHNFRLKGLKVLLRAMQTLIVDEKKDLYLIVLGRGRISSYKRMAKKLNIADRVLFLGSVSDVERYYAASDIYVHPTFYDSCSLSVLEAFASGLPVITTKYNGASDIIRSKDGGIVLEDPADFMALKDAILYFMDEGRRAFARKIVRKWMEEFGPERNIDETLKVYHEILTR